MTTPIDTAALLALCEQAERDAARGTPGKWAVGRVPGAHQNDAAPYMVHDEEEQQIADCYDNTRWSDNVCGENAHVIVTMRTREPLLAAGVRALVAENQRLTRYAQTLDHNMGDRSASAAAQVAALTEQLATARRLALSAVSGYDAWQHDDGDDACIPLDQAIAAIRAELEGK